MNHRLSIIVLLKIAILLAVIAGVGRVGVAGEPNFRPPESIVNFLQDHCLDCHSGPGSERGLDLEELSFDLQDELTHAKWVRAMDRVADGEMPPEDAGRPDGNEMESYVRELSTTLSRAESQRIAQQGRSQLRRLSRAEHINALRDLLHMPLLQTADKLPPDPLSDGFGKSSSTLPFSHVQVDRYLEVADSSVRAAMAPTLGPPEAKIRRVYLRDYKGKMVTLARGTPREVETLELAKYCSDFYLQFKSGSAVPIVGGRHDDTFETFPGVFKTKEQGYVHDQPPHIDAMGILVHSNLTVGRSTAAGRYRLRIDASAFWNHRGVVGSSDRTEVISIYGGGRLVGAIDVDADSGVGEIEFEMGVDEPIEISMATLPLWRIETGANDGRYKSVDVPGIALRGFELQGPLPDDWPPPSHRRLFGELPMVANPDNPRNYEIQSLQPEADARRLLISMMRQAYRRDVTPGDLVIPMRMFTTRSESGASFSESMISAYAAVLSSPSFTLVKMDRGPLPAGELINRLSLFLWNTPATGELRDALTGEVAGDPPRYRQFVERMIDSPNTDRFIEHFLDHWLDLRNLEVTEPDENLYSGYSPWLLESMRLETQAFFREMLRDDLPAATVVDSDFLMINGALAEVYGIDAVHGSAIRRVAIDRTSPRGGLLTQASVMKVSANGTTTSPVVRGAYVMDRILGDPPPPPPEAVAAVEPDISGVTTIRQQLAKHREDPSCASCHRKIDPPGFALEAFDVMGRYRDRYHSLREGDRIDGMNRRGHPIKYKLGLPVDCSGEVADGRQFGDINDFRELVLDDPRSIAENLLERLVVYATGHRVGIGDRPHVESILDQTAAGGYGLRSMILGLVQSPMFRQK